MFNSIGAFSAFFFPAVILVIIGIFFEEDLIALESKMFKSIARIFNSKSRNNRNKNNCEKNVNKNTKRAVKNAQVTTADRTADLKRRTNNAA